MVNREIVMDYILPVYRIWSKTVWKLSPTAISSRSWPGVDQSDGSLNDAGRQIDISIPINILLDVKTPAQLMKLYFHGWRINNGAIR